MGQTISLETLKRNYRSTSRTVVKRIHWSFFLNVSTCTCITASCNYVHLFSFDIGDVIINNCFLHKGMDYELHKACSRYTSAGQVQYVKIDKHGIEDSVDTINLTQPSDQAKFLCLNNSTLVEIVYVMIKGT